MGKHTKIEFEIPAWVESAPPCLRSVAEDVYYAKALAKRAGATTNPSCTPVLAAAGKSMRKFEDQKASERIRCAEGDRAARKFWEAKVCARG